MEHIQKNRHSSGFYRSQEISRRDSPENLDLSYISRIQKFDKNSLFGECQQFLNDESFINNQNINQFDAYCELQYHKAIQLSYKDEQSRKKALLILQFLFNQKIMIYETNQKNFPMKQSILLNYWKLMQQIQKNQIKLVQVLKIGYLFLKKCIVKIKPKKNNLLLILIILAKQQLKGDNPKQSLQLCDEALSYLGKGPKINNQLLKIHYMRAKIFQRMKQYDQQLQEIKKCLFFIKTLTITANKSGNDLYKILVNRRDHLLKYKNDSQIKTMQALKYDLRKNNKRSATNKFKQRENILSQKKQTKSQHSSVCNTLRSIKPNRRTISLLKVRERNYSRALSQTLKKQIMKLKEQQLINNQTLKERFGKKTNLNVEKPKLKRKGIPGMKTAKKNLFQDCLQNLSNLLTTTKKKQKFKYTDLLLKRPNQHISKDDKSETNTQIEKNHGNLKTESDQNNLDDVSQKLTILPNIEQVVQKAQQQMLTKYLYKFIDHEVNPNQNEQNYSFWSITTQQMSSEKQLQLQNKDEQKNKQMVSMQTVKQLQLKIPKRTLQLPRFLGKQNFGFIQASTVTFTPVCNQPKLKKMTSKYLSQKQIQKIPQQRAFLKVIVSPLKIMGNYQKLTFNLSIFSIQDEFQKYMHLYINSQKIIEIIQKNIPQFYEQESQMIKQVKLDQTENTIKNYIISMIKARLVKVNGPLGYKYVYSNSVQQQKIFYPIYKKDKLLYQQYTRTSKFLNEFDSIVCSKNPSLSNIQQIIEYNKLQFDQFSQPIIKTSKIIRTNIRKHATCIKKQINKQQIKDQQYEIQSICHTYRDNEHDVHEIRRCFHEQERSSQNNLQNMLVTFFMKEKKSIERRKYGDQIRQQLYNAIKYYLICCQIDQNHFISMFFDVFQVNHIFNVNNKMFFIKMTYYRTKNIYLYQGEFIIFKFQVQQQTAKTKKLKIIATKIDLQQLLHKKMPNEYPNKQKLIEELIQVTKKFILKKDYIYFTLGLQTSNPLYYMTNKFDLHDKKSPLQFLKPHLKKLTILCQKIKSIKFKGKLRYSIMTVKKADDCQLVNIIIHLPEIAKNFTFHIDQTIVQYFEDHHFNHVFSSVISDYQNLKKQQLAGIIFNKNNLDGNFTQTHLRLVWNHMLQLIQFQQYSQQSSYDYFLIKFANYKAFIKDSTISQYILLGENLLLLEISLQKGQSLLSTPLNNIPKQKRSKKRIGLFHSTQKQNGSSIELQQQMTFAQFLLKNNKNNIFFDSLPELSQSSLSRFKVYVSIQELKDSKKINVCYYLSDIIKNFHKTKKQIKFTTSGDNIEHFYKHSSLIFALKQLKTVICDKIHKVQKIDDSLKKELYTIIDETSIIRYSLNSCKNQKNSTQSNELSLIHKKLLNKNIMNCIFYNEKQHQLKYYMHCLNNQSGFKSKGKQIQLSNHPVHLFSICKKKYCQNFNQRIANYHQNAALLHKS